MSDKKLRVGILGCTGAVGQRFVELLESHPYFVITALGASDRSAGKAYKDAVTWRQSTPMPAASRDLVVTECTPAAFVGRCDLVFSGLDSNVAGQLEEQFAAADLPVFSNARNHRMDDDVPILIPEVNPDHIDIVHHQRRRRGWRRGFIVTNANCSTTGLVIALKPILDAFGIDKMFVTTMQAISGAGYPGVPSLDIVDNVVPYISGEEEKMQTEPCKIFGAVHNGDAFEPAELRISAHCNRVAVIDGHTECVSLSLRKPASVEEVVDVINTYRPRWTPDELPSAPRQPLVYLDGVDRPQPRLDRGLGRGFTVSVGRVRACNLLDIKLTLLSHNTIIGAAGGSILNAELAYLKGLLS